MQDYVGVPQRRMDILGMSFGSMGLLLSRLGLGFFILCLPLGISTQEIGAICALAGTALIYIFAYQDSNLRRFHLRWLYYAFLLFLLIKIFDSDNTQMSWYVYRTNLHKGFALFFAGLEFVRKRKDIWILLGLFAVMGFYEGLDGIYQYVTGHDLIRGTEVFFGRLTGSMESPRVGNLMSLVIPCAVGILPLLSQRFRRWGWAVWVAVIAPQVFLLLFSFTKSGWIGVMAALIAAVWLIHGVRKGLLSLLVLGLLIGGTSWLLLPALYGDPGRELKARPGQEQVLDKSDEGKTNLVRSPRFTDNRDWQLGAGWRIANGEARHTPGGLSSLTQNTRLSSGMYLLRFEVSPHSSGEVYFYCGERAGNNGLPYGEGVHVEYVSCSKNGLLNFPVSSDFDGALLDVALYRVGRFEWLWADPRFDLWEIGWRLFLLRPLSGVGIGAFGDAGRARGMEFPESVGRDIAHPHNIYVQLLAETGVIGLGLFLACVGSLAVQGGRAIRRGLGGEERQYWKGGALVWSSCLGYLATAASAHGFFRTWWLGLALSLFGVLAALVVDRPSGDGIRQSQDNTSTEVAR